MAGQRLRLTINGRDYFASMQDSPLLESLIAQLPLELHFQEHAGNEYYARLPQPLQGKAPMCSQVKKNMICFFEGWNAVNIIYADSDISPWKVTYLGELEEDVSAILQGAGKQLLIRIAVED